MFPFIEDLHMGDTCLKFTYTSYAPRSHPAWESIVEDNGRYLYLAVNCLEPRANIDHYIDGKRFNAYVFDTLSEALHFKMKNNGPKR